MLPLGAAGDIGDLDALCFQLVANAVGFGEVFGLLGVVARLDLRCDRRIVIAILAEDGIRARGRLLRCIALADLIGLFAEVKAQNFIKIVQNEQLRCVVGLVLEYVVKSRNGQRRVEVIAERGIEFLTQRRDGSFVNLAVAGLQRGDLRQELLIRSCRVVKVFPRKDEVAAVMALQAEQTVAQKGYDPLCYRCLLYTSPSPRD